MQQDVPFKNRWFPKKLRSITLAELFCGLADNHSTTLYGSALPWRMARIAFAAPASFPSCF